MFREELSQSRPPSISTCGTGTTYATSVFLPKRLALAMTSCFHVRMPVEHRHDFLGFNTEAPDLDLVVDPAHERNLAVRQRDA